MNINELTIGQAKELASMFGANQCVNTLTKTGDKVLIRTLTNYYTGEVVEDNGVFVSLKTCAWIADTGRFNEALSKGTLKEVEPIGNAKIMYNNIVDCIEWKHELPTQVK